MGVKTVKLEGEKGPVETIDMQKTELADAHCHLDMIQSPTMILDAIRNGVHTIITDGVNNATNARALEIADNKNIFPALGIDPENAILIGDGGLAKEIKRTIGLIAANRTRVVAIGEIGLDYKKAKKPSEVARQKRVFGAMLDAAKEFGLPVSVHSRDAMDDVFALLEEKGMERVHLHFFEGNVEHARIAERRGYLVSMPPLQSSRRKAVIKELELESIVAESDAPAVGATPFEVKKVVEMVAGIKEISFERAAGVLTENTKRLFGIGAKSGFMRL